jgi:hypothetical protein
VLLNLPIEIRGTQARLLVAGTTVPMEKSGGQLSVTVASILDHEVIAIEI